jgi:hypothetical protein
MIASSLSLSSGIVSTYDESYLEISGNSKVPIEGTLSSYVSSTFEFAFSNIDFVGTAVYATDNVTVDVSLSSINIDGFFLLTGEKDSTYTNYIL